MRPTFSARTAVLLLLALIAAAVLSFRGIYEPDLWWHLAQGRENAAGRLVHANVFNFIYPAFPQPYTPWLFDLTGYLAWRWAGGTGIQLAQAACLALTFVLLYVACRERASASATLAVFAVGFFVIEPRAIPRPHLVTFAGTAACTLLIERARRTASAAPLRWAIPLVALWSNLHVECVFGVLLVALVALAELVRPCALSRSEARRALAIAAACAAATLANPYGWGLERYLLENWRVPQMLNIAELRPAYLPMYRAFFVYLALAAALLLWRARAVAASEVLAGLLFAALGVRFLRFTPLVFLVTAPMLAERITWMTARAVDGRAVVLTAAAVGLAASRLPVRALTQIRTGDRAVAPPQFFSPLLPAFAKRVGLHGPVFNSMNLGGYLAWELYPDTRTFQDGRLQAVPRQHFPTILDASRSQAEWDALVAGVDWAVLSNPRPDELSGAGLFPHARWSTIYWDEAVEVLVRRTGQFAALAQPYEYTVLLPDTDASIAATVPPAESPRLVAEARRNMTENPEGFVAPAVLCRLGDADACARVRQLAAEHPRLRNAASRILSGPTRAPR